MPWDRWGPYLSERQWGTVREDTSADGDAWDSFPHDHARSRAYRYGEDGLAGVSDDRQQLCFALALWNERDPILKERLFGLTNSEGNHGEDVKEYYYYLDNTPTHAYMRYLYKYPQAAFPYADLVDTNRARGYDDYEYELIDTGVFDDDRYFDVVVEYAKRDTDELLARISVTNRGAESARLHVLPTLWFRNTWADAPAADAPSSRPQLTRSDDVADHAGVRAVHPDLGEYRLIADASAALLFCENETNRERLWGQPNTTASVKDAIDDAIVHGRSEALAADPRGTKVAVHHVLDIEPGATEQIRVLLTSGTVTAGDHLGAAFEETIEQRRREADEFYAGIVPDNLSADAASVMRQSLAGMLWTKQYYSYDLTRWLAEHGLQNRYQASNSSVRNNQWFHMINDDVISMPDKWEYPWYAAWDLAFHTIALGIVDVDFAKRQLLLMLDGRYLHPNGQIPAYEWNFSDVNPPVHAWAVMRQYETERSDGGPGDIEFLREAFNKLALNYTWWVNRKDPEGDDLFGGGFLGLDNIGVFDRSKPLPTGGRIEQADGTAWMAFFALTMLEIAIELALHDDSYEPMAAKFFEHFLWIAGAMDNPDNPVTLWDDEDGFFYDALVLPDGRAERLKVRSIVGLLPVAACVVLRPEHLQRLPRFMERVAWLNDHRPDLVANFPTLSEPGVDDRRLLAVVGEDKLQRVFSKMLDESEFLSPHGIRSVSKCHAEHPYVLHVDGAEHRVDYLPAESDSGMFGGNSNWRGPVWFPINYLLARGVMQYASYYGDTLRLEFPTGSGEERTLFEISVALGGRLASIFTRDDAGRRPVFGGAEKFQTDPHWRDHILFYEYFHGDDGAGLGASHQTGWTGLVARLMQLAGNPELWKAQLDLHMVHSSGGAR